MQASTSSHTRQRVSIGGHWSCPNSPRPSYSPSGCRPYQPLFAAGPEAAHDSWLSGAEVTAECY